MLAAIVDRAMGTEKVQETDETGDSNSDSDENSDGDGDGNSFTFFFI